MLSRLRMLWFRRVGRMANYVSNGSADAHAAKHMRRMHFSPACREPAIRTPIIQVSLVAAYLLRYGRILVEVRCKDFSRNLCQVFRRGASHERHW